MKLLNLNYLPLLIIIQILLITIIIFTYYQREYIINELFRNKIRKSILLNLNYNFRLFRIFSLIMAIIFIGFSILDPRWGEKIYTTPIEGIDVVFVIDVSRSMNANDIKPDRLSMAKELSIKLANLLIGSRIGLCAFAGYGFSILPLTSDIDALIMFISELTTDMIDIQGTNIDDAIKKALELFEKNTLTHKAIVIFSDGEDNEFSTIKSIKEAKERNIYIYTIGIGTKEGAYIPIYDERGKFLDYYKKNDKIIRTFLNQKLLEDISKETKGEYFYGDEKNIGLIAEKINDIKKNKYGMNAFELIEPQYHYFLLIGILFLLIYIFLPERKLFINYVLIIIIFISYNRLYSSDLSKATKLYKNKNYEDALKYYQKSITKSSEYNKIDFNIGNTFYKLGNYDLAIKKYDQLSNCLNYDVRYKAYFNKGNSYIQLKKYDEAIQSYKYLIDNLSPNNKIFKKAIKNFIYIKQNITKNKQENQNNKDLNKDNFKNNKEMNNINELDIKNIDNLLNMIEEEERKYLKDKYNTHNLLIQKSNDW